jgi:hypothetical protein
MRLLIDANLSPRIARGLHDAGLDATHVADVDLLPAIESDLDRGAIASLSPTRPTLRDLPLLASTSDHRTDWRRVVFSQVMAWRPRAMSW